MIGMMRHPPSGRSQQRLWRTALPAGGGRSTQRNLAKAGCYCATVVAFLLFLTAELPSVLTAPSAPEVHTSGSTHQLPAITEEATCQDWAAWIPQRSEPAVVMQVVSKDYIAIQRNFIRLMERNSSFNRHNLYLMCMDDDSKIFFENQMGVRCVPMSALHLPRHEEIWKLRVRVLSCLITAGRVDVIMSDADALWLGDPARELFYSRRARSSARGIGTGTRMLSDVEDTADGGDGGLWGEEGGEGIWDSDVVASRGKWPFELAEVWGSTICMGFILFRANNVAGMGKFLGLMEHLVEETEDDQISINQAAADLGIVWDEGGDMRYEQSTGYGRGVIPVAGVAEEGAAGDVDTAVGDDRDDLPLTVALLPHNTYTRVCKETPVSEGRTVVAHCFNPEKKAGVKTSWMEKLNLWSVEKDP